MKKMRIFTWHVHGSYLYYLSQGNYDIYIPKDYLAGPGYQGRGTLPFGDNVIEIPASEVKHRPFDCILFQSEKNYLFDQYQILNKKQRNEIPKIYLEHDPPRRNPTDTVHVVSDPKVTVVHVTAFNRLMWNNETKNVRVIAHGVTRPKATYCGDLEKGAVVVNNLADRGRRLGADIFLFMREAVPLDLIGMDSERYGGVGEVPLSELPAYLSSYRFLLNPIRYTSLGLSVCEAMMLGMPIVGLATTEMVTVIKNNSSGFIHTDPAVLVKKMKYLLKDQQMAAQMGKQAQNTALNKFDIHRFTNEWTHLFQEVISRRGKITQLVL